VTIELSEPQQFYPNEKFYIIVSYEFGVGYPQGGILTEEPVQGRFFFQNGEDWLDVTHIASLESYMWMIKAIEEEHVSASWVRVLTPVTGEVETGQALDIEMEFIAAGVRDVDNMAKLIVETNDPINPVIERSMSLRLNQGPSFTIDSEVELIVNENETLTFDVTASDYEGDACSYALTEENSSVTISEVDDVITVTYQPDYNAAGVNIISITGTDAHNHSTVFEIPVEVVNVNRLPEVTEAIEEMVIVLENGVVDVDLDMHISDPDGEELMFEVSSSDYIILDVFVSGNKLKMEPLSVLNPDVDVTVTATDIHGAVFEYTFAVKVIHRTGIDDMKANSWRIYPNPATSVVNIEGEANEAAVQISILNAAGAIVKEVNMPWSAGQAQTINIDDLAKGIYLLEIQDGYSSEVYKLIKK
ncbi:MAG: T9SS type A sorting domain-containing protein, partial [Bacteroidales bacterium]|nr:T9SS type A sorting domain-containing protein [Bacteroidales bacterium]